MTTDYKSRLLPVQSKEDILPQYRDTPIGLLLEYHNLDRPFETYDKAQLLIGMCMDNRKHLHMPDNFAFIIRSGGANLRYSEFKVSYAIAIAGLRHIALIGHNNCGMVDLMSRKGLIVEGLVETAGWNRAEAEEYILQNAPLYEIGSQAGSEPDFILSEARRLRKRYPKITIAPMLYLVEDNKLYFIREE